MAWIMVPGYPHDKTETFILTRNDYEKAGFSRKIKRTYEIIREANEHPNRDIIELTGWFSRMPQAMFDKKCMHASVST